MSPSLRWLLLSVCLCCWTGCGDDSETKTESGGAAADPAAAGDAVDTSTPAATFNAFQQAARDGDYQAVASHLTEESQTRMLGGLMMIGAIIVAFDEDREASLTKIIEKHGGSPEMMSDSEIQSPEQAMEKLNQTFSDKSALIADLISWMDDQSQADDDRFSDAIAGGTLGEVTINGNTASAPITTSDGRDDVVNFVKVGDGWKIELPADAFDMSGGPGEMNTEADSFDGQFASDFEFGFDESDALPPAEAVTPERFDEGWQIDLEVTNSPLNEVLTGLMSDCGFELKNEEEFADVLATPITLKLEGVSRLEAIEKACQQVDVYPRYRLRQMILAKGSRPHPVAFTGPFLVTISDLEEHVPYAVGTAEFQLLASGLPVPALSYLKELDTEFGEDSDGALNIRMEGFQVSEDRRLEATYSGGFENLVSQHTLLAPVTAELRGLTKTVTAIQAVSGEIVFHLPAKMESVTFDKLVPNTKQTLGDATFTLGSLNTATGSGETFLEVNFKGVPDSKLVCVLKDDSGSVITGVESSGFYFGEEGERHLTTETKPASLEIRIVTETHAYRYPFELGQITLTKSDQMPEAVPELKFEGDTPVTISFDGFEGSGRNKQIKLTATNHANLPVSMMGLKLEYLDGDGKVIDDSPHGHGGQREMIPAGESMELQVSSFFMPEGTNSVRVTTRTAQFADNSVWNADEE